MRDAYLGVDIGSISTKAAIIGDDGEIFASTYLWTEGNPIGAVKRVLDDVEAQLEARKAVGDEDVQVVAVGTTGSARELIGVMLGAQVVKNEITAHAMGTLSYHPDAQTILEIGGQDSKIIILRDGIPVDYAMNTLCAAGTGSFLSSQSRRLGIPVEEFGDYALRSKRPDQDRRALHGVRRERPRAQGADRLQARGHHRGAVQRDREQLPEQRGQGQRDPRAHRVPGRRLQERRRRALVRADHRAAGHRRRGRTPDGRASASRIIARDSEKRGDVRLRRARRCSSRPSATSAADAPTTARSCSRSRTAWSSTAGAAAAPRASSARSAAYEGAGTEEREQHEFALSAPSE